MIRGLLIFLAFFALGTALTWRWQATDRAIKAEQPAKPEPLPCGAVKGQFVTSALAEDCAWRERRDRALESCYRNGGVAALGFNFSVVCIEANAREYDPGKQVVHETRRYEVLPP